MQTIDKNTWARKEHYDFFASVSDPFYSLTFPVDVTALKRYTKARGLSFYYAMCFLVTKAMDRVENFRYKDREGTIVLHDHLIPSFTDLHPGSDLFHITTLEAGHDLDDFCRRAREKSHKQTTLMDQDGWSVDQLIYFSCLPWFPVTALTNEKDCDPTDSVPRVAWGRYEEREGKLSLLISLELNHRLIDGVHVGKMFQELTALLAELPVS